MRYENYASGRVEYWIVVGCIMSTEDNVEMTQPLKPSVVSPGEEVPLTRALKDYVLVDKPNDTKLDLVGPH